MHRIVCAAALCSSAAFAAHVYSPFTNDTGSSYQGLWLADRTDLGVPVLQLTDQTLDGPYQANFALFSTFTYDSTTREHVGMEPQFLVYGVGGKLWSATLKAIAPVQQFSSGTYAQLCSIGAVAAKSFASTTAYVVATVIPSGSTDACGAASMQTWLIRADAGPTTAPTVQPANWTVLGAFTNPTTDAFVRYVVWDGTKIVTTLLDFSSPVVITTALPPGPAPAVWARVGSDMHIVVSSDSGGVHTDTYYHFSTTARSFGFEASFTASSGTAPCGTGVGGAVTDVAGTNLATLQFTDTGYSILDFPMSGGAPHVAWQNTAGGCPFELAEAESSNRWAFSEDGSTLLTIDPTLPATQTPVTLPVTGALRYVAGGHNWVASTDPVTGRPEVAAADGDGTFVGSFVSARIGNDLYRGARPRGVTSFIDRQYLILSTPFPAGCAASLFAVDSTSLATTSIGGFNDICSSSVYGFAPIVEGRITTPAGTVMSQLDTATWQMSTLLGPSTTLNYLQVSILPGYPFY